MCNRRRHSRFALCCHSWARTEAGSACPNRAAIQPAAETWCACYRRFARPCSVGIDWTGWVASFNTIGQLLTAAMAMAAVASCLMLSPDIKHISTRRALRRLGGAVLDRSPLPRHRATAGISYRDREPPCRYGHPRYTPGVAATRCFAMTLRIAVSSCSGV